MDILYGEYLTGEYMEFLPTDPYNDNFELFGLETQSFMLMAGSYFILQMVIVVQVLFSILLNKLCAKCYKFKMARAIGTYIYQPMGLKTII
jgi:hypothetical protein